VDPSLHHLALRTPDVEGLARFYERWLGLRRVDSPRLVTIWLALGQNALVMIELAGPGEPAPDASGLDLLAIRVSSETKARLRAELANQSRLESETDHTLYFRDPDGRRIAVSTYPLGDLGP
jgi:catechol 2,3-dioxygenase-like lactoylglutathione lyase family enzyme